MDRHGERQAADEDLFDSLVLAYDEALAAGTVPEGIETTGLTPEQASRLASAYDCLALLEKARRDQAELLAADTNGKAPLPDGQQPESEYQIGRFEVERELGRGGYGVVLLARDPLLNRRVALKVPRPEVLMTADLSRRFLREAQAAGSLQHPNLVAVYEVGQAGPVHYIASAYCEGPTLADWRERLEHVPVDTAVQIVAALADGVSAAHQHGILHRDIKPGNVLLEPRGDTTAAALGQLPFIPKLTDFGLAKLGEYERDATRTGILLGTPAYMAPEQAAGKLREVGPATDIFALGAVLYELLTGRRAFQGASDVETLRLVAESEPRRPRQLRPEISRDLEAVCLKCLEKQPQRRYASTALLADDLRRCLAGKPTLARPLSSAQRLARWARRQPAAAALAALSAGSVLLFIGVLTWHSATLSSALKVTQQQRDLAEQLRLEAAANGRLAAKQELIANQHLYALRMRLAHAAIEQGDAADGTRLLEMYATGQERSDLRGFEWALLRNWMRRTKYIISTQAEAYAVAFSPDGSTLSTGSENGRVEFWDRETGGRLSSMQAHASCVNKLSYSPDGSLLASGGCDNTVRLWDLTTQRELATLLAHDCMILWVEFSHDGAQLAALADDGLVVVWDVATRSITHRAQLPGAGQWLSWNADDTALAVGTKAVIQIWNTRDWSEQELLTLHTTHGTYCPDGRRLIVTSPNSTLVLVDLDEPANRKTLLGDLSTMAVPVLSPSGHRLALCPDSGLVQIYDSARLTDRSLNAISSSLPGDAPEIHSRTKFAGHRSAVKEIIFSPDERLLASASRDGTVRVWEAEKPGGLTPFTISLELGAANESSRQRVAFDRDLKQIIAIPQGDTLLRWNISQPSAPQSLPALTGMSQQPKRIAWGPDDHTILVGCQTTGEVSRWNLRNGSQQPIAQLDSEIAYWTTDYAGSTVTTLCANGLFRVHDVATGMLRFECSSRFSNRPLKPDNLLGFSAHLPTRDRLYVGRLDLLNLQETILGAHPLEVREAPWGFSPHDSTPDGRLAAGVKLTEWIVGDNATLELLSTARLANMPACVAISPDHRTLATLTPQGVVTLWHVPTGQHLYDLDPVADFPLALKFSADGTRLGAITQQAPHTTGHAYVWTIGDSR